MADPLLRVEKLVRRFGGILASDNVSLQIPRGELHAIIGPNGAGKTTLIGQLTGHLMPHAGSVFLGGRDITHLPAYRRCALGLARSFQITSLLSDFTAADNVALAAQAHDGTSFRFFADARKESGLRSAAFQFGDPPCERARVLLGALEGAMLVARSYGDPRRFDSAAEQLLADIARDTKPAPRRKTVASANRGR